MQYPHPQKQFTILFKELVESLPDAYLKASTFTRKGNEIQLSLEKNLKTKLRRNNILLQGGDQVFIASRSQLVTVTGEVNNPGKNYFFKR